MNAREGPDAEGGRVSSEHVSRRLRARRPGLVVLLGALLFVATVMLAPGQGRAGGLDSLKRGVSRTWDDIRHPDRTALRWLFGGLDKKGERFNADMGRMLAERERAADEILKENQHILAGYLSESTQQLNDVANAQQDRLRSTLLQTTTQLGISTELQALRLEGTARLFLIGLLAVLLTAAIFRVVGLSLSRRLARVGGLVAISLLAAGCSMVVSEMAKSTVADKHREGYAKALQALDFDVLELEAHNLVAAQPGDASAERLATTKLLVKGLTRAAAYRPDQGLDDMRRELADAQAKYSKRCGATNPYLDVVEAMILWQSARDRFGEFKSGVSAARSFAARPGNPDNDCIDTITPANFPLWALSRHYLESYLARPLEAAEFAYLIRENRLSADQSGLGATARLSGVLAQAKQHKVEPGPMDQASTRNRLALFADYGAITRELRDNTVPAYSVLAYAWAMQGVADDAVHRAAYAAAGLQAAEMIVAAYDSEVVNDPGWITALASEAYDGTTSREAGLRSGHALYTRAWRVIADNTGIQRPQPEELRKAYAWAAAQLRGGPEMPPPSLSPSKLTLAAAVPLIATTLASAPEGDKAALEALVTVRIARDQLAPVQSEFANRFTSQLALDRAVADSQRLRPFEDALRAFLRAHRDAVGDAGRHADLVKAAQALVDAEAGLGLFVATSDLEPAVRGLPLLLLARDERIPEMAAVLEAATLSQLNARYRLLL